MQAVVHYSPLALTAIKLLHIHTARAVDPTTLLLVTVVLIPCCTVTNDPVFNTVYIGVSISILSTHNAKTCSQE